MGRLRDGYDSPLWRSINEEVVDLFGNEDGIIHRLTADPVVYDPTWGEPTGGGNTYRQYKVPYVIQDWSTPIEADETGSEVIYEATIFVSRAHMDKAGIPKDSGGDQIRPGDIFETWFKGDRIFWDIIGVDRQGFVNDSDYWTQVILTARRNSSFVPERRVTGGCS